MYLFYANMCVIQIKYQQITAYYTQVLCICAYYACILAYTGQLHESMIKLSTSQESENLCNFQILQQLSVVAELRQNYGNCCLVLIYVWLKKASSASFITYNCDKLAKQKAILVKFLLTSISFGIKHACIKFTK